MKGGIYPVLTEGFDAFAKRLPVSMAGERRKLLNYGRLDRESDNWDKVGHEIEIVNFLNGFATVGSGRDVVPWWVWLFGETPLWRDEQTARVYGGVQWAPELFVASIAESDDRLAALRPLIEDRMMAWLGAIVPDCVDRQPRKIREHYPERKGTAVFGTGEPVPFAGFCWVGVGDRSWVIEREGEEPHRGYLDSTPVGELLAVVLNHPWGGRVSKGTKVLETALVRRGFRLWRPAPEARELCLRALAGDVAALTEVFGWRNRCPHTYRHVSEGGRTASNSAWSLFPHGKRGSTSAAAAGYSAPEGDGWMSPNSGDRSSGAGDNDAAAFTCEERELEVGGRSAVAWRLDAPERLIVMGLPHGPDTFRYRSGPEGHQILIPGGGHVPPPTPHPVPPPAPTPPPTPPPIAERPFTYLGPGGAPGELLIGSRSMAISARLREIHGDAASGWVRRWVIEEAP